MEFFFGFIVGAITIIGVAAFIALISFGKAMHH
jgi:hypothetical protein